MINLQKGQRISLTKDNNGLSNIAVGLGWDEREPEKKGLFGGLFSSNNYSDMDIDCDASAFLMKQGKIKNKNDVVYYGHLKHSSNAVQHTGDNLTGAGDGDDETIFVSLKDIPDTYDSILFVVNIYQATSRGQHFGMIENAFIRVYNRDNNEELCRFELTDDFKGKTALICGEIYKKDGEWKFNAIGEGINANTAMELANRYM